MRIPFLVVLPLLAAKARVTGSRVVPTASLRGPNREKKELPRNVVILLSKWPVRRAIETGTAMIYLAFGGIFFASE